MIRDAFHREGPFVGSGGLYSPGPATTADSFEGQRPLDDALTSPWAFAGPWPSPAASDSRRFFARDARRRFTADDGPGLGPCSLTPPLFLECCARAYSKPNVAQRLLQQDYDVRALRPELSIPRRDEGRNPLPFLTRHDVSCESVARGEPRSVRSDRPRCRFLSLARACPTAMPLRARHPVTYVASVVAIDVHGPLDRVKDVSPDRPAKPPVVGARAFWRRADDVPLLGVQRAPVVVGAVVRRGGDLDEQDGPTKIFVPTEPREGCRHPGDRVLSTVAKAGSNESLRSASRFGLPLTPPTRFPRIGEKCLSGIASTA